MNVMCGTESHPAPSGRISWGDIKPRALPWAVSLGPFGADRSHVPTAQSHNDSAEDHFLRSCHRSMRLRSPQLACLPRRNAAKCDSPGQRPGYPPKWNQALKGRNNGRYAPQSRGITSTGTNGSHQHTRPECVLDIWIVIPSPQLIRACTHTAKTMFDRIHRNTDQSRTLATLHESLLPELLSGELSVGEMNTANEVAV